MNGCVCWERSDYYVAAVMQHYSMKKRDTYTYQLVIVIVIVVVVVNVLFSILCYTILFTMITTRTSCITIVRYGAITSIHSLNHIHISIPPQFNTAVVAVVCCISPSSFCVLLIMNDRSKRIRIWRKRSLNFSLSFSLSLSLSLSLSPSLLFLSLSINQR